MIKRHLDNLEEQVDVDSPAAGILHHARDWVLIADFNSNYCFPVHICFTQLGPDITIFSNNLRKVILIELPCPCEENMES